MAKTIVISLLLFFLASNKPVYQLFDSKGKKIKYSKMLNTIKEADIVLFGELHKNPICHWLEYKLLQDLYHLKASELVLGMEMFESDNQLIIDEYFGGKYNAKKFEDEIKLWSNYKTDYKPQLEYAKKKQISFIATNIPRRYSNMVYKKGFSSLDSLSNAAKKYIANLPIKYDSELKCYKEMLEMSKQMGAHSNPNFPKAQAVKDATMAQFILNNWEKDRLFLHFQGAYHSDNYQGIVWYLLDEKPDLKIVTISSVEQKNLDKLEKESLNLANYIIAIDEDMTKTN